MHPTFDIHHSTFDVQPYTKEKKYWHTCFYQAERFAYVGLATTLFGQALVPIAIGRREVQLDNVCCCKETVLLNRPISLSRKTVILQKITSIEVGMLT